MQRTEKRKWLAQPFHGAAGELRKRATSALTMTLVAILSAHHASAAQIAVWNFNSSTTGAVNNSPAADVNNSAGTPVANSLGMMNSYSYPIGTPNPTIGSVPNNDFVSSTAPSDGGSSDGLVGEIWRIRGPSTNAGPGTGNGWNTAAPQYSQGAEFDINTVGYQNLVFSYDWYATNQGVRDLQAQYTTDGTTWANVGSLQVAPAQVWQNQITIDFGALGIHSVDNNPLFGVRLVSAYDPTFNSTVPNPFTGLTGFDTTYTASKLSSGNPVILNNTSGNWRFDEISASGTPIAAPEPSSVVLAGIGLIGLSTFVVRKNRQR